MNTYLISLYISYGLVLCEAHFTCEASLLFPKGKLAPEIYNLRHAYPMKITPNAENLG